MVKRLEELSSRKPLNLKELKQTTTYEAQPYADKGARKYSCDCDQWGGGDPPCDCNK